MIRSNQSRFAIVSALALAVSVCAGAGTAQAVKVSSTANGGLVPDATGGGALATQEGLFTQRFKLGGKKLKKQQTFDVTLAMSGFGSVPGANSDLRATLVSPKGEKVGINLPARQSFTLLFQDRSGNTQYCNPFVTIAIDCLYATGVDPATPGTGAFTGNIDNTARGLNSTFRGVNPSGTWTLNVWDTSPMETNTLGNSVLSVKTIANFVKDKAKKKKKE